jgi:hypothetical protein
VSARAAPLGQLDQRDPRRWRCRYFPLCGDGREQLLGILPLALGFDQNAGIEDQSHAGGSSGSRWLSMAASTSLEKSASITAVESSGKSAMHSEMVRHGGAGASNTATGNLRLSITTSAPARTRASTSAKLLAASLPRCGSHGQPWRDYTVIPTLGSSADQIAGKFSVAISLQEASWTRDVSPTTSRAPAA